MAYSKLYKVTSDFAVGYGIVNQYRDNQDATKAAAVAQHGSTEPISLWRLGLQQPPRPLQLGHHADGRIPRASMAVVVTNLPAGLSLVDTRTTDPHFGPVVGLGVGILKVEVRDLSTFWGHGVAHATSTSSVRFVQARTFLGGAGQPPCLIVTSYELNGGDLVPTNYDFDLHLYGTP